MSVPTFSDLLFYSNPESQEKRYHELVRAFKDEFGKSPDFISRSPGRVNLIGDHIDYAYFPVFPMAIESDVLAAVSVHGSDSKVVIANTDSQFATETFQLPEGGDLIEIDIDDFQWGNYFKCGLIVAQKYIEEKNPKHTLKGLNVLFNGTVPTGGGLLSLAAFCVASTLLILRANGVVDISKKDLTRITVVSEHYIGLNNGGMDQTALIYGEKGKALLVTFQPKLEGIPFSLPEDKDLVFLITNTLITANKKETAPVNYNLRAVEAAVVAEVLAAKFEFNLPQDSNLKSGQLRGFMEAYFGAKGQKSWKNEADIGIERTAKMLEVLEEVFDTEEKKTGFTTEQAAEAIGISIEAFQKKFLTAFPVKYEKLKLYQRSKHIYSEARRVLQLIELLQSKDKQPSIEDIGQLFNESHQSLRNLYETVPPQMDKLVEVAKKHGVAGSRVTGAGFGGSVVHILKAEKLDGLLKALKEEYYSMIGKSDEEADAALTVTKAGQGTCVVLGKFD